MIKKEDIIKRKEHSFAVYSGKEYKGESYYHSVYGAAKEVIYLCNIILELIERVEKEEDGQGKSR